MVRRIFISGLVFLLAIASLSAGVWAQQGELTPLIKDYGFEGPLSEPIPPGHFILNLQNGAKLVLAYPTDQARKLVGTEPKEIEILVPVKDYEANPELYPGFMLNKLVGLYGKHFLVAEKSGHGGDMDKADHMNKTTVEENKIREVMKKYGFEGPLPEPFRPGHFVFETPNGAKLVLVYPTDEKRNITGANPVEFEILIPKADYEARKSSLKGFEFNDLVKAYGKHFVLEEKMM